MALTVSDLRFLAFRYALGRMSYITHEVADNLIEHWDELDPFAQSRIQKEIADAIDAGLAGAQVDVEQWRRVLDHAQGDDNDDS